MNARKYELLTRAFFLTAIVSSLLYGKLGSLNWIALGLGIAAAVGAAATYFWNAYSSEKKSLQEAKPQTFQDTQVQAAVPRERYVARSVGMVAGPKRAIQGTLWREAVRASVVDEGKLGQYYMLVAEYQKHLSEAATRQEWRRRERHVFLRERKMFLDEVVELVNRLTPTCEVQVSLTEGHLTIRPLQGLKGDKDPADLSTPVTSLLNRETSRQVN